MAEVTLMIDGVTVNGEAGASVLDVARGAGRQIPALCHHEGLAPIAACRLCLVEVRRPERASLQLTTSCDHPVFDGIEVVTDSALIRKHRAMNLQLLLPYAPDAPAPWAIAADLGITDARFAPVADAPLPGCILCELCVRVCAALGHDALSVIGRGEHKRVGPPFGLEEARNCVGCGSCHAICPTGCIPMEETATTRTIWGRTLELFTCRRCGAPFMTRAQRTSAMSRGRLEGAAYDLCDRCRRTALADAVARSGGSVAARRS